MSLKILIIVNALLICFSFAMNIPYQGSLEYKGNHSCGVTIISLSTFLTAAHCVEGKDVKDFAVRAGTISRGEGGKTVDLKEIKIHPNYDNNTLDYDLAVLIPTTPFPSHGYVTELIEPIKLAKGNDDLTGKNATTSGWGYDDSGDFTETLMYVELPILSRSLCEKYVKMTDRKLCAGDLKGGRGTCHGDAGGPLEVDNVLVGITSSDDACGDPNKPNTFTDIRVLESWIKENTVE